MADLQSLKNDLDNGIRILVKPLQAASAALEEAMNRERYAKELEKTIADRETQAAEKQAVLDGLDEKINGAHADAAKIIEKANADADAIRNKAEDDAGKTRAVADKYAKDVQAQLVKVTGQVEEKNQELAAATKKLDKIASETKTAAAALENHRQSLAEALGNLK